MNEIKVLGNLPKMNKDKKLLCKLRRYSFRNLTEKRTNKKIKGWRGGGNGVTQLVVQQLHLTSELRSVAASMYDISLCL